MSDKASNNIVFICKKYYIDCLVMMAHVEQELLTLSEHLRATQFLVARSLATQFLVARSLVFCVMFYRLLLVLSSFIFFWSLHSLLLHLRLLVQTFLYTLLNFCILIKTANSVRSGYSFDMPDKWSTPVAYGLLDCACPLTSSSAGFQNYCFCEKEVNQKTDN